MIESRESVLRITTHECGPGPKSRSRLRHVSSWTDAGEIFVHAGARALHDRAFDWTRHVCNSFQLHIGHCRAKHATNDLPRAMTSQPPISFLQMS